MILLLAVAMAALPGATVVGAAVAQRRRELALGGHIAALRRRAAPVAFRLPAPANDTFPVMGSKAGAAQLRRRADRVLRR